MVNISNLISPNIHKTGQLSNKIFFYLNEQFKINN